MRTHPLVSSIPDRLLLSRAPKVARELEEWCTARNFRPTLLDIVQERQRRGAERDARTP